MVKWDDYKFEEQDERYLHKVYDGDRLSMMFAKQQELMDRYGIEMKSIDTKEGQQQLRDCGMWLFEELGEIFHCLKNKAWTQQDHEVDKMALYDEVADAWHFFIELNILLGVNPQQALELYIKKNKANHKRIDTKY